MIARSKTHGNQRNESVNQITDKHPRCEYFSVRVLVLSHIPGTTNAQKGSIGPRSVQVQGDNVNGLEISKCLLTHGGVNAITLIRSKRPDIRIKKNGM